MSKIMRSKQEVGRVKIIVIIACLLIAGLPVLSTTIGADIPKSSYLPILLSEPIPENNILIDQTAEIENILWQVNEGLMSNYIQTLQDFDTRFSPVVESCFAASEYIYSSFINNGLTTYYDPFQYRYISNWDMRNVVAELPGTVSPDEIYIICGHYDAEKVSPGADDNGSGTAAVLAAAELLSDYEFNKTIRFVAFSGEEQGLRGSKHYAEVANASGENIAGVINLDMIGYNPDPGTDLIRLVTNVPSEDLANFTVNIGLKYQGITQISANKTITTVSSDHKSFYPYEYSAVSFFEERFSENIYYHQPTDIIDNVNMTYVANSTQIAIATLAELAELNSLDIVAPAYEYEFPIPNGYGNATPFISIDIRDPSPINFGSIQLFVEGAVVVPTITPIPLGYRVTYPQLIAFIDGQSIQVRILADDGVGNTLDYTWDFTVDAIAPSPPSDFQIDLVRMEPAKYRMVLDKGINGVDEDFKVVGSPSVIFDGEYKMFYSGGGSGPMKIFLATSNDGLSWTRAGKVIPLGSAGEPDSNGAYYPTAIFDGGMYKMWYTGYNGTVKRIMYATSLDGLFWTKQGVVIDLGADGELDDMDAFSPCVIKTNEYEMWYTGFDGINPKILYANSSDGINWNKHGLVLNHTVGREYIDKYSIDPSVIFTPSGYKMWYTRNDGSMNRIMYANSTDGLLWHRQGLAIDNGTVGDGDSHGSSDCSALYLDNEIKIWYGGRQNPGGNRIFYANISDSLNKTDLGLTWSESSSPDVVRYELIRSNTPIGIQGNPVYLDMKEDTTLTEVGIGDDNITSYYYYVRAVDRVGNVGECPIIVGKIGKDVEAGWNLISSPLLSSDLPLSEAFTTIQWESAQYYDASDNADHWKTYFGNRPASLNDLQTVNNKMAVWVSVQSQDVLATTGQVTDISINMEAGWNFVSYPYHEEKAVQDALVGLPYDGVEEFDTGAPYNIDVMLDTDIMYPGQGYWVHLTSATVWNAINT